MLILNKDYGEYCEVTALINGQPKKSYGFIYLNNVFIKVKHYSIDEYEEAIKDCRENFLDNEKMEVATVMLKEPDSISIWIQDDRYKPLNGSVNPSKTPASYSSKDSSSTLKLQDLVARMRGKNGLKIKTRRYKIKLYQRCFLGNEAIDWLVENFNFTRPKAIRLGQKLIDKKIIHHVTDDHNFKDEPLFYRFYKDEEKSIWTQDVL